MSTIIQMIDQRISTLTRARDILLNGSHSRVVRHRRAMSPETKAKIGKAMRKRWQQRRAA